MIKKKKIHVSLLGSSCSTLLACWGKSYFCCSYANQVRHLVLTIIWRSSYTAMNRFVYLYTT